MIHNNSHTFGTVGFEPQARNSDVLSNKYTLGKRCSSFHGDAQKLNKTCTTLRVLFSFAYFGARTKLVLLETSGATPPILLVASLL